MIAEVSNIIKKNLFLIFLITLIAFLSFQLGRNSKQASQPIKIEKANIQEIFQPNANVRINANDTNNTESRGAERIDFRVVVSKKSTSKKYHFLWCPGAKQIKEENKIYFNSEKEAVSAGYSLAGNCAK
ncbi:MAG: hypothetical protein HY451_00185 [Parcubacteria group bacterium]|nr:hypothetical protein [Parcubacteria group bacterium]